MLYIYTISIIYFEYKTAENKLTHWEMMIEWSQKQSVQRWLQRFWRMIQILSIHLNYSSFPHLHGYHTKSMCGVKCNVTWNSTPFCTGYCKGYSYHRQPLSRQKFNIPISIWTEVGFVLFLPCVLLREPICAPWCNGIQSKLVINICTGSWCYLDGTWMQWFCVDRNTLKSRAPHRDEVW